MHRFFDPLDDRETMLLLTTLTVGGSSSIDLFQYLPDASRDRVQQKAQALLGIDKEKRVAFMVKQIRQAVRFKGVRGVEKMDPSWLLSGMKGESPRIVATILISLPPQTVRSVLKRLPSGIRQKLPPKNEIRAIPMDLVRAVRQIYEARFHRMPQPSAKGFAFRDIIQLERKDLYVLMRSLGLYELGQAFVSVGKMALVELCRRLPRSNAEELIMAFKQASEIDAPTLKSAQHFLSRVVVNFKDTEEFFQKAGLWRLAKCSLIEPDSFRVAFQQRLPKKSGQVFDGYLDKAATMEELTDDLLKRLQDSAVLQVVQLARRDQINPRWKHPTLLLHDPSRGSELDDPDPGSNNGGGFGGGGGLNDEGDGGGRELRQSS